MRSFRNLLFPVLLVLFSQALAAQLRQIAMVDIPGRPGFDSVAFAGNYLVIAHRAANAVDIFDPRLRRLKAQITGVADPRGIAVDNAAGRVYIASAGSNSLVVLSTTDWKPIDTIRLKHSPDALLLAAGKLYIGNWLENSVTVLDLERRDELTTLDVGGRPQDMLWDPGTNLIFTSLEQLGQVIGINPGQQIAKRYQLRASQPTGLALDTKGRRLFVAVRYAVLVLDADSGAELARIPATGGITTLWFDAGQQALYAAATNGSVNLIATAGDRFLSQHELQTQVHGHSFAYDPAKKTVYLTGGREGRSKLVILKTVDTQVAAGPASGVTSPKAQVTAEKK
ncbi:MAG TPA: YncE family protein [Terriglobales bacterium]|nr:YncE family protein [Terriglobales bacterium]